MMRGETVLQAMCAAGVLRDVAADRADLLTGGVGRVVITERRDLPGDLEVGHAGIDDHAAVWNVDRQDAIEPGKADDDAAGHRQCAAGQPGAVTPGNEWDALARAQPDDPLHLFRRVRQHHDRWHLAQMPKRIALIGEQLQRLVQDAFRTADPAQLFEDRVGHGCCDATLPPSPYFDLRPSARGTRDALRRPIRIRPGCMRIKLDYGTTGLEVD